MNFSKSINIESLENSLSERSTKDILQTFLWFGLQICQEKNISFWHEDIDWKTFDKLTDDNIESIYINAKAELATWSQSFEDDEAIKLVIHSIEALRGDMRAAIFATSKLGIFSQYNFYEFEINKDKKIKSNAGKKYNKHLRDDLTLSIYKKWIEGKKYSKSKGYQVKLHIKDMMLGRDKYKKYENQLNEILDLNDEKIARIIRDTEKVWRSKADNK